jgi:hypothetical protein
MQAAARLTVDRGKTKSLPWRVLPDDKTPSFVQIWLPETKVAENSPAKVSVALEPPQGAPEVPKFSKLGNAVEWRVGDDAYACIYHQRSPRPEGKSRECITIAIRSTAVQLIDAESGAHLWADRFDTVLSDLAPRLDEFALGRRRHQAGARIWRAIAVFRMCCQRRVAEGTYWLIRDRQPRRLRSSSWHRQ